MKNWKSREMKREGKWETHYVSPRMVSVLQGIGMFRSSDEVCSQQQTKQYGVGRVQYQTAGIYQSRQYDIYQLYTVTGSAECLAFVDQSSFLSRSEAGNPTPYNIRRT